MRCRERETCGIHSGMSQGCIRDSGYVPRYGMGDGFKETLGWFGGGGVE